MARLIGALLFPHDLSWKVPLSTFDLTRTPRPSSQFDPWRESCYTTAIQFNLTSPRKPVHLQRVSPSKSFPCTVCAHSWEKCRTCGSNNGMILHCMNYRISEYCVTVERSQCEFLRRKRAHSKMPSSDVNFKIQDEGRLAELGYTQELRREWSLLHNFDDYFYIIVSQHCDSKYT